MDEKSQSLNLSIPSEFIFEFNGLDDYSAQFLQQIWHRRAEQLAQPLQEETVGEQMVLVLARLGGQLYGFDTCHVFEIRPLERITRVPRTPAWILGVVNLRGRILSVLDLPQFMGMPLPEEAPPAPPGHLIVIETPALEVALIAEEVQAVQVILRSKIQPATDAIRTIRPEYLIGVIPYPDSSALIVLDLPALMADPQLILHEELI